MQRGIPSTTSDLDVLRTFEPIVRYTRGEKFFPMDVEPYVRSSSLWMYVPDGPDVEVVPEGELTLEELVERRDAAFGSLFYLRFVHPLDLQESTEALAGERRLERRQKSEFRAGVGRLARGGLLPRVGDGLFSFSLLLRGNVPGATAAAAALKYDRLRAEDGRFSYQGRVVRQAGWTVCQYWFFFAYNPWRSGFHGVNDHESDWEMVSVFLYEHDGLVVPEWVAYASHDFHGSDLRRRWDDSAGLERVDSHPVVYAGAGSHASYFKRGEYQAEVPFPLPRLLERLAGALTGFWRERLGQTDEARHPLRIPFIDFARGDGLGIGPGEEHEWSLNVIDETTPWAARYRGLWGLYARDPISGEDAPAGPMYERDGSPRASWFDPLGFAGLAQVSPPPQELEALERETRRLEARQTELDHLVAEQSAAARQLGARLESMHGSPFLAAESARLEIETADQLALLAGLRKERSENVAVLDGLRRTIDRRRAGEISDPRAHIRRSAEPVPPATMRFAYLAEVWAALSTSLLLFALAVFILLSSRHAWADLVVLVLVLVVGESVIRGTFVRTINRVAVVLALVAVGVLVAQYAAQTLAGVLVALGAFLLYQRLRELRA